MEVVLVLKRIAFGRKAITRVQLAILIVIIVAAVVGGVAYYYLTLPVAPKEVKIGIVLAKTGKGAYAAERAMEGIELAIDEINAAGGIKSLGGIPLRIIVVDSESDPKTTGTVTERLITEEKPAIIFGDYITGDTLILQDVCEKYGMPNLAFAGSPIITGRGLKWSFRTHPHIEHYQRPGLELMKQLGVKRIAIVYDDSAWGKANREFSLKLAPEYGMEIVLDETYAGGTVDFSPLILKIKAAKFDALLTAAYLTDALLFVRQLRELNVNVPLNIGFAVGYADTTFWPKSGGDGEYTMFYTGYVPEVPTPESKKFVADFEARYGKVPDPLAEWGYADMYVIADVLERAGSTDPDEIRKAIIETDLMSPAGRIEFGPDGQNYHVLGVVCQYQNEGQRIILWPSEFVTGEPIYPMPTWEERG